jgi:predicted nucleotidyltransferase
VTPNKKLEGALARHVEATTSAKGGVVYVHTDSKVARRPFALSSRLRAILNETETALRGIYGDRFLGLVLFGSHARSRAVQGSDIDLILLLQDSDGARERRRYAEAVADLSLRYDTVISLVPMGIEEFRLSKTPFLLNVRREGIRL